MKIALIGADGQLGSDLYKFRLESHETIPLTHKDIDITKDMSDVFNNLKPNIIINTAAFHNVPLCEQQPDKAVKANGEACYFLSEQANKHKAKLIHISTDYVFDGNSNCAYEETSTPNPINVYGKTKLMGELFIRGMCKDYYIIRTSGLYGHSPCRAKGGLNFVENMLAQEALGKELKVVADEILTPTYTEDVAKQIWMMLTLDLERGIYHVTNQGACSWWGFASEIFSILGKNVKIQKVTSSDFPSKVQRPKNSVLNNSSLQRMKADIMPHWKNSLAEYLKSKK